MGNHAQEKNLLIMLVDKTNDLPAWFCLNNPNVKILHLTTPSTEERNAFVKGETFRSFFQDDIYENGMKAYTASEEGKRELVKVQDKFVFRKIKM